MDGTVPAGNRFVTAHAAPLRALVSRRVPGSVVDDVCQDIWLAWWQAASRARPIRDPDAFLHTLAIRRIADFYRAGERDAGEGPKQAVPTRADDETLESILRQVNVTPGSLMWRRIVDGCALRELAQDFDLPLGTVKSRLHHERQSLAHRLHDWRHPEAGGRPLAVCPCPACRRTYRAVMPQTVPSDWHQALSVTVASTLAMRLDATLRSFRPLAEPQHVVSQSADWPRPTRIQTPRGQHLLGRWGRSTAAPDGRPQMGFTLQPADGPAIIVQSHLSGADTERLGLISAGRDRFTVRVPVTPSAELDDAFLVQLPPNARLEAASPPPAWVGTLHSTVAILWHHTNRLPTAPTVVAHWDRA